MSQHRASDSHEDADLTSSVGMGENPLVVNAIGNMGGDSFIQMALEIARHLPLHLSETTIIPVMTASSILTISRLLISISRLIT